MFQLSICPTGTINATRTQHESESDARQALAHFARGYDIQGRGESGTLTTKCGRVNQASYTWNIRTTN